MLNLYLEEVPDSTEVIDDVEDLFKLIELRVNNIDKLLVKNIDNGELIDSTSFIDRFGISLYLDYLSTGGKAALCVANSNKVINLKECGYNAHDVIISYIKNGSVYIPYHNVSFGGDNNDIDVCLDKYRFSSLDRLNYYIDYERPFKPNMEKGGVVCLS